MIDQSYLDRFVREGSPRCPGCRQEIALDGDRCRRCGEQVELRVAVGEPRLALMVTGLVGICLGLGFNGIVLIWGGYSSQVRGYPPVIELTSLFISVLILLPSLCVWLGARSRIRRMGEVKLRVLAIGAVVFSAMSIATFFLVANP